MGDVEMVERRRGRRNITARLVGVLVGECGWLVRVEYGTRG